MGEVAVEARVLPAWARGSRGALGNPEDTLALESKAGPTLRS